MAMKHRPCAYCGRRDIPREKGHVIQDSLYPSNINPRVQRPTVAECVECKKIWQDAEHQFRNIMVLASDANSPASEQWYGPIRRSWEMPSGPKWLDDVFEQLVPVNTPAGPRFMVFPQKDARVMLVVRKIVRGLCAYHRLGTAIADNRVFAHVLTFDIPPEWRASFVDVDLDPGFCQYAYRDFRDEQDEPHSAWLLQFYERCTFLGLISENEDGWQESVLTMGTDAHRCQASTDHIAVN